jgi:hypothetical protein
VKPLLQAIEAIRAALKGEASPASVEEAAILYAQQCAETERRLDRVAAMLEKGSDYQALQVAEEEPPLLDLAATLSFGEEKNWHSFCEVHGLKTAPRLNARNIQDLESLYARGISANHPLYKDFRAAVLSRDDAKSLRIVKTILKLNPQDENARKELLRLENKGLQEKIDQLREALKTDDEERIATLTESIKAVAPPDKLERLDVFQEGEGVRTALRRRQAEAQVPETLATLHSLQKEGQWRQVGRMLEMLDGIFREHGLVPADDAQQAAIAELTQYYQKEKAAEEKQRSFDTLLKGFLSFVAEVETRLLTGSGVTYEEIAQKDESFIKRWKELEACHLPVPAETLQRMRAAGQGLRSRLERMQRAKRLGTLAMAAAALVLLGCLSAVGLHAWKAWTLAKELASYQSRDNTSAAEDLIKKLRAEEGLLLRWPFLQARTEEVSAWAASSHSIAQQADAALLALENSFTGDTTALPASQLVRQLDDAAALVRQLGGDLAAAPKNRLAALNTKADLHLATVLKQLAVSTSSSLTALEKRATAELSYEKLASTVAASAAALDQELKPVEALLQPEAPALVLPTDLEARIRDLRRRLAGFQDDLRTFADVRAESARAATLEDYRKALAKWKTVKFAEAAPALKMLDTLPSEKDFQASLFTGGDPSVLQSVLDDKNGRYLAPEGNLLEAELKMILGLLHDENLNNIFENTLAHYSSGKPNTTLWSVSRPEQSIVGSATRWSGKFYEPDKTQSAVLFIQKSFTRVGVVGTYQGDAVLSTRLSTPSEFMNQMEFSRITDEKGQRVLKPLLEVCDKVVQDKSDTPVAKAYVMLRLEAMMQLRPSEWCLYYCPSLQQDFRSLHQIIGSETLRSEDWLVPAVQEKWTAPLTAFFKSCREHTYLREARAQHTYLRAATAAGLKFAGYVETDLSLVLNQQGRTAAELWAVGREGGRPLRVDNPSAGAAASGTALALNAPAALPLSPVFLVPADRRALLRQYQEALSSGTAPKPLSSESPFLTQP